MNKRLYGWLFKFHLPVAQTPSQRGDSRLIDCVASALGDITICRLLIRYPGPPPGDAALTWGRSPLYPLAYSWPSCWEAEEGTGLLADIFSTPVPWLGPHC